MLLHLQKRYYEKPAAALKDNETKTRGYSMPIILNLLAKWGCCIDYIEIVKNSWKKYQ